MVQETDPNELNGPTWYKIEIAGCLQEEWAEWFAEDLVITKQSDPENCPRTILVGPVTDQPALRGILNKLWNLNMVLISVNRIPAQGGSSDPVAVLPERKNEQVDQRPFVGREVSENV